MEYDAMTRKDEEEREPIDIKFAEQNADSENNENAIEFRWSDGQEEDEEDIS